MAFNRGYDGPSLVSLATVIEVAEPSLAGPVPLWRYVVPPGVNSVEFPLLSSDAGEAGLNGGFMLLNVLPFIAEGRFNYDDFTYLDINGSRWISYGITSATLSSKYMQEYDNLRDKVDAQFEQIFNKHQREMECNKGCHDCCAPDLSVTQVEAEMIKSFLIARPDRIEAINELIESNPHQNARCEFFSR